MQESCQTEEIKEQCEKANETEYDYPCTMKKTETLCENQPVIMKETVPAKETYEQNGCPQETACKVDASEVACKEYPQKAARNVDPPEVVRNVSQPDLARKKDPPEVARKVDLPEVARDVNPPEVPPRAPTSVSEFDEQPSLGDSTSSESKSQKSTRKRNEEPTESQKNKIRDHRDLNKSKSPTIRMVVHDLAGQAIYYDTHYLFLKSHAPYILVHDLTKPLDVTAEPRFKPSEKEDEQDLKNPLLASNLDYMLSWLNVLEQFRKSEEQEESENKQEKESESEKGEQTERRKEEVVKSEKRDETERKKEKAGENEKGEDKEKKGKTAVESEIKDNEGFMDFALPPVVIALTNKDHFTGDIEEVKRRIQNVITEGMFTNVFPDFYVIDNTKTSGKNDPIKKLRHNVFKLCQEFFIKNLQCH